MARVSSTFLRMAGHRGWNRIFKPFNTLKRVSTSAGDSTLKAQWDALAEKYAIHPETRATTLEFIRRGYKSETEMTLEDSRRQFHHTLTCHKAPPFDGQIEEIVIPSPHQKPGIPASVYKPASLSTSPQILVHFHGGGLVSGSKDGYGGVVQRMASATNAIMVNVEYRLLPNKADPFAPFNDCVAATKWVLNNKLRLGGQAVSKVGLVGDSAGGQLSACVSCEVEGLSFQVLIYPIVSYDFTTTSATDLRDFPGLNTIAMEKIISYYLEHSPDAAENPRFNPSLRDNLGASPPTLILVAELDPLKDGGVAFAEQLDRAGVPSELICINGFAHGFMCVPMETPTGFSQGLSHIARFVRSFNQSRAKL